MVWCSLGTNQVHHRASPHKHACSRHPAPVERVPSNGAASGFETCFEKPWKGGSLAPQGCFREHAPHPAYFKVEPRENTVTHNHT